MKMFENIIYLVNNKNQLDFIILKIVFKGKDKIVEVYSRETIDQNVKFLS